MLIKKPADIKPSEITPKSLYMKRRDFIKSTSLLALGSHTLLSIAEAGYGGKVLQHVKNKKYSISDKLTKHSAVTSYNNFYEFGTDKGDPAKYAHTLTTTPWDVTISGAVEKPGKYALEDLMKPHALEERIYRFRCVERWSMVVPWIGFSLADMIKRFQPTSNAKYVMFKTLHRPSEMRGQRRGILDWPYVEGLRMDEAMHPLTMMVVGLYGEVLPNQNGAPLRLMVPWKYGFKSIKSITHIHFTEQQPVSSWTKAAPNEYGFYSNVNPKVDHPRWSQKRERRIGEFLKRDTLMFNGYADEVANLYSGMDLKKFY